MQLYILQLTNDCVQFQELSKDPKLFAEGGPTQNDILQTRRAQGE